MNMFYNPTEIRTNNGRNGQPLWIVISDIVYDVSTFVKDHPGGPELIEELGGNDATESFERVMHSSSAKQDLAKYRIGETKWETNVSSDNQPESFNTPKTSCLSIMTCGLCGN